MTELSPTATVTATRSPIRLSSTCFNSVVFPVPRGPRCQAARAPPPSQCVLFSVGSDKRSDSHHCQRYLCVCLPNMMKHKWRGWTASSTAAFAPPTRAEEPREQRHLE